MTALADELDLLRHGSIREVDPAVAGLLAQELDRQRTQIELVASENFTWPSALGAVGSAAANKLADGYPGRRETGGCEVIDQIELLAVDRARALFGAEHANVQPHSGAQANMAVYFACLAPGDTILAMSVAHGGHHTHGVAENFSGRFYRCVTYGVDAGSGTVDFREVRALALRYRPKLIVCGGSAYPRAVEVGRFREVADEAGALLLCDMAHIAGLVAAGLHPSPVPIADFVTSTVHKTLAGPRCGGFVLCRRGHAAALDRAVSPGVQSAPLPELIAAKAVCFGAAATEAFRSYQHQVLANASAIAAVLTERGFALLTGGTDTHLLVVDMTARAPGSADAEQRLAGIGITVSRCQVPSDASGPARSSGLRIGAPAITMRGFDETDAREVALIVADSLETTVNERALRERVRKLCDRHPLYPGWRGYSHGRGEE